MTIRNEGSTGAVSIDMREGDRFVCPNCGCQITLEEHGDPARMTHMEAFTCCCGTRMEQQRPA